MFCNETICLLDRLKAVTSQDELWRDASRHLERLGFTHAIYLYVDTADPMATQVWSSLPDYWRTHYLEAGYDLVDPFLRYCCASFEPIRTGADYLHTHSFLNSLERQIIHEGGETGFRSGFSSPVGLLGSSAFGGWNFGTNLHPAAFDSTFTEIGVQLRLDGFFIHEHLQRLTKNPTARRPSAHLTPRERECLLWLARGLRVAGIAERLHVAEVTVELHLRGARRKLRAATREEALVKAILDGQICP